MTFFFFSFSGSFGAGVEVAAGRVPPAAAGCVSSVVGEPLGRFAVVGSSSSDENLSRFGVGYSSSDDRVVYFRLHSSHD